MPIPKYDDIFVPILQFLKAENRSLTRKDLELPLAEHFALTDEEVSLEYESKNGRVFNNRISWALSNLYFAGLLDKPKRGVYQLSETGEQLLATPNAIHKYVKDQNKKRDAEKLSTKTDFVEPIDSSLTPLESLEESYNRILKTIYDEILETILRKTPTEFEKTVVLLLQKMGYGGKVKSAGFVTKKSNDGGIDGVIKEDVLGLGRIHIQAKRYAPANTVGREEIQKFVGALAVAQSNKGVFITTSRYSKGAIEYANNLNGSTSLILMDGQDLASYIYEYDLGMQTEQVFTIKKLDSDFWDEMQENKQIL